MSLFDFFCKSCITTTEREYRIGTAPEWVRCPRCGKRAKRIISPVMFVVEGGTGARSKR